MGKSSAGAEGGSYIRWLVIVLRAGGLCTWRQTWRKVSMVTTPSWFRSSFCIVVVVIGSVHNAAKCKTKKIRNYILSFIVRKKLKPIIDSYYKGGWSYCQPKELTYYIEIYDLEDFVSLLVDELIHWDGTRRLLRQWWGLLLLLWQLSDWRVTYGSIHVADEKSTQKRKEKVDTQKKGFVYFIILRSLYIFYFSKY